jgi:hypothetical protein
MMKGIVKMDYNGVSVAFEGKEKVSLTDLWRAAGSPENKEPYEWLRTEHAKALIAELEADTGKNRIVKTAKGGKVGGGGTWAHRDLAVSYAGYLSPKLQIFVNRVFLERLQEDKNPDLIGQRFIDTYKRKGFSDARIALRFKSIQGNKEHNEVLARHGVDKLGHAMCAHNINIGILGTTKKKYLSNRGIEPTADVRDYMTDAELAAETLAELLSDSKIEKEEIFGNKPCAKVCHQVAKDLSNTVQRIVG